jgi:5-hydroxyisourate hydrolase-like protein (transthyretin family)
MVTVKVVHQSTGKPAEGRRVVLYVDRFLASGFTDAEFTNTDGLAHFEVESTDGEVYVDGASKHKGRLAGRIVVYI